MYSNLVASGLAQLWEAESTPPPHHATFSAQKLAAASHQQAPYQSFLSFDLAESLRTLKVKGDAGPRPDTIGPEYRVSVYQIASTSAQSSAPTLVVDNVISLPMRTRRSNSSESDDSWSPTGLNSPRRRSVPSAKPAPLARPPSIPNAPASTSSASQRVPSQAGPSNWLPQIQTSIFTPTLPYFSRSTADENASPISLSPTSSFSSVSPSQSMRSFRSTSTSATSTPNLDTPPLPRSSLLAPIYHSDENEDLGAEVGLAESFELYLNPSPYSNSLSGYPSDLGGDIFWDDDENASQYTEGSSPKTPTLASVRATFAAMRDSVPTGQREVGAGMQQYTAVERRPSVTSTVNTGYRRTQRNDALAQLEGRSNANSSSASLPLDITSKAAAQSEAARNLLRVSHGRSFSTPTLTPSTASSSLMHARRGKQDGITKPSQTGASKGRRHPAPLSMSGVGSKTSMPSMQHFVSFIDDVDEEEDLIGGASTRRSGSTKSNMFTSSRKSQSVSSSAAWTSSVTNPMKHYRTQTTRDNFIDLR